MKTHRLWKLAKVFIDKNIIEDKNAFLFGSSQENKGLEVIFQENTLPNPPYLNNSPRTYEEVNYLIYIYSPSMEYVKGNTVAQEIYKYIKLNPKIAEAQLIGITPYSVGFLHTDENKRSVFLVELTGKYILDNKELASGNELNTELNAKL